MCLCCLTRGRADTQVFTVRKAEREEAYKCVETTLLDTLRRLQGSGNTGVSAQANTGGQSSRRAAETSSQRGKRQKHAET